MAPAESDTSAPPKVTAGPSTLASMTASGSTSTPAQAKKRKASPRPSADRLASIGADNTDADDDNQSVSSRLNRDRDNKRTRVHFSCVECHRRKQKCDRKEPCSQCVARRVPQLCRPFLNGAEDPSTADVQSRLTSIESLLSRLVSSLPSGEPSSAQASSPADLSALLQGAGEDMFHPASGSEAKGDKQMPLKPPPSGQFPAGQAYSNTTARSGYGWGLGEGRLINLVLEDNTDLQDVLTTLKESGISKSHLEWLIAGVPGRRMADGLVELYFRDIDWTRYKIDKPSFLKRYEVFFDSIGRNPSNPKVDGDTLRWLPLLFIVLAITALSAPSELVPSADQAAWSRRFYGSARSSLEYAKALQRDNLDVLFAGLLASRYMLLTRRPAEGSTPLTTAFQLGLYRDGSILNITDKRDVEVRRRAWAMLYHLDRTISLLVGRPASISDAHTDTRMPANLEDEELEGDFDPAGHPLTTPTVYTYIIVRHKLAEIMGRIAYHTFAIQLPDYQTVLELDKELLAWRENLPPFFRMTKPDMQFDKDHSYLFVQRHLLACEWFYTRITLNRPYLLRRKPQDARYAYSKDAAIESATADLLSRRSFIMEKGNLIVNSGGYRVLNSYMVLGVTIKLDPESAQADKLRRLLNVVSGRAPDTNGRISEPLVKEELAIVEFLTAKTNIAPNSQSTSSAPKETPVDLLLGLAKTRSGRRAAEEERRQLRQQAAREVQEQSAQRGPGAPPASGGMSSSPWGYKAPSMPGLDVVQPFNMAGQRRDGPRPLQPPPTKRGGPQQSTTGWSPDFNMPGSSSEMIRPTSAHSYNPSPESIFQSPNQHQNHSQQHPNFSLESLTNNSNNSGGYQLSPYQQLIPLSSPQNQGQSLNLGPGPSSDPFAGTTLEQFFAANNLAQGSGSGSGGQMGGPQFGHAIVDQFDFSNLGLDLDNGPVAGGFNPFALPQTEEGAPSELSADDETQFLNYILTKFANSQPEVQ